VRIANWLTRNWGEVSGKPSISPVTGTFCTSPATSFHLLIDRTSLVEVFLARNTLSNFCVTVTIEYSTIFPGFVSLVPTAHLCAPQLLDALEGRFFTVS
jgi:hypothetical protein